MAIWGITETLPVLLRNASVLIKARSILAKKGSVVAMIDRGLDGSFSPNLLYLCGKVNAKLVFFFATLQPNGSIDAKIVLPPHPLCEHEVAINNNIYF